MSVSLIYCQNDLGYIGKDNQLLYSLPSDLKHFRKLTTGHTVLMGRKTWESLPESTRPLPNRTNIVVTSNPYSVEDVDTVSPHDGTLECLLNEFYDNPKRQLFVIGGAQVYEVAHDYATTIYVTHVKDSTVGDVKIHTDIREDSAWMKSFVSTYNEVGLEYSMSVYRRKVQF